MGRRLSASESNLLIFDDNLSGSQIYTYYRMPSSDERVGFMNMAVKRENGEVVTDYSGARVKFGLDIMTGFRDGDFEVMKDGKWCPLSSDPQSPNYDPNWRDIVKAQASDIVELLGIRVFETSVSIANVAKKTDQD